MDVCIAADWPLPRIWRESCVRPTSITPCSGTSLYMLMVALLWIVDRLRNWYQATVHVSGASG
jgi:hypothetical protein